MHTLNRIRSFLDAIRNVCREYDAYFDGDVDVMLFHPSREILETVEVTSHFAQCYHREYGDIRVEATGEIQPARTEPKRI